MQSPIFFLGRLISTLLHLLKETSNVLHKKLHLSADQTSIRSMPYAILLVTKTKMNLDFELKFTVEKKLKEQKLWHYLIKNTTREHFETSVAMD